MGRYQNSSGRNRTLDISFLKHLGQQGSVKQTERQTLTSSFVMKQSLYRICRNNGDMNCGCGWV